MSMSRWNEARPASISPVATGVANSAAIRADAFMRSGRTGSSIHHSPRSSRSRRSADGAGRVCPGVVAVDRHLHARSDRLEYPLDPPQVVADREPTDLDLDAPEAESDMPPHLLLQVLEILFRVVVVVVAAAGVSRYPKPVPT